MNKKLLHCVLLAALLLAACTNNGANNNTQSAESLDVNHSATTASEETISDSTEPTLPPEPTPTPFPTDNIKEYDGYGMTFADGIKLCNEPSEDSFVHAQMQKGTQLHLTGKYEDKWYYADLDGQMGFVKMSSVAFARGYVNADEVKLREKDSRSSDVKKVLAQHTELYAIKRLDDWYKVVAIVDGDALRGYVYADYFAYYEAYATGDDIRLRTAPSTDSETIERVPLGKKVSVIAEYKDWYKVSYGEKTGFMSKDYVAYSPTVTKLDKTRGYVNESGVNFREGPSTDCKAITRLAKFAPVYITGESDEWYRVTYNEQEGYISKDFVEIGKLIVYVSSQDVNLRAGPSTDSDLLTKVRQNSVFEIIGADGEWLKGIVNHNTGYIRSDYLSKKEVNGGKKTNEFTDDEIYLAAKVVYLEARDHGTEAYRAVANVLYNRVKSHKFPNKLRDVVFQSGQFSVTWHKNFSSVKPSTQAYNATKDVLNGGIRPMPFNVLFFHASYLGTHWGSDKVFYKTVGDNSFFRYRG